MSKKVDHWEATRHTLLARLKDQSDAQSWQEFFDIYARLIFAVALQSGLARVEAEEVVQETVLSVSKKINQFKADRSAGSFKAWLSRLIQWRIKDQVRKRRPEEIARIHRSSAHPGEADGTATEESLEDPAAGNFEAIWEQEWHQQLRNSALDRLKSSVANPAHYQMFQMYVIQERPVAEVAEAFGVTEGQVYLVKHRLVKMLEQHLSQLQTEFQ